MNCKVHITLLKLYINQFKSVQQSLPKFRFLTWAFTQYAFVSNNNINAIPRIVILTTTSFMRQEKIYTLLQKLKFICHEIEIFQIFLFHETDLIMSSFKSLYDMRFIWDLQQIVLHPKLFFCNFKFQTRTKHINQQTISSHVFAK